MPAARAPARPTRARPRALGGALCLTLFTTLPACQATDSQGRPEPSREPRSPVTSATPARVVPVLYQSLDTDSNGMVDTLTVSAYLFPQGSESAIPVWSDGQFVFSLSPAGAQTPLATWAFPADQVLQHRDTDLFGPTHLFSLDIRAAAGTDRLPSQRADLSARFVRNDGVTISSSGGVSVQVGP